MLTTAGHIYNVICIYMNKPVWEGISFHFLSAIEQHESSNHCRASILEEEFKFQYVRRDIHIHITTQNIILKFFSK